MTRSASRRIGAGIALGLTLALGGAFVSPAAPALAENTQVRDLEYWLNDYGFTQAWNTTRGAGVTVAVIDTGVAAGVADLTGAVVGGVATGLITDSWGGAAVGAAVGGLVGGEIARGR